MTNSTESGEQGVGLSSIVTDGTVTGALSTFALTNGSFSGSVSTLPGGTYDIWGQYGGDGTYAMIASTPVQITVTPEASTLDLNIVAPESTNGYFTAGSAPGNQVDYGTQMNLSALVAPSSKASQAETCVTTGGTCPAYTAPTGVVKFLDDSTTINTAAINAEGDAEFNAPFAVGTHSITATYAGDNSYSASPAVTAIPFTVIKDTPNMEVGSSAATGNGEFIDGPNQPLVFSVVVLNGIQSTYGSPSGSYISPVAAPTGTVTVTGFPSGVPTSATLSAEVDPAALGGTQAVAGVANIIVPAGTTIGWNNLQRHVLLQRRFELLWAFGVELHRRASRYREHQRERNDIHHYGNHEPEHGRRPTRALSERHGDRSERTRGANGRHLRLRGRVLHHLDRILLKLGDHFELLVPAEPSDSHPGIEPDHAPVHRRHRLQSVRLHAERGQPHHQPAKRFHAGAANHHRSGQPQLGNRQRDDSINVTSVNGFTGTVDLTCKATSPLTCTISPSPALTSQSSATSTLTVNVPAGTANGNYDVLVTGKDAASGRVRPHPGHHGGRQRRSTPGFALTNSGNITVIQGAGATGTSTISATPTDGFTGTVNLSCAVTAAPTGATSPVTCSIPSSVDITGTAAAHRGLLPPTHRDDYDRHVRDHGHGYFGRVTETTVVDVTVNLPSGLRAQQQRPRSPWPPARPPAIPRRSARRRRAGLLEPSTLAAR